MLKKLKELFIWASAAFESTNEQRTSADNKVDLTQIHKKSECKHVSLSFADQTLPPALVIHGQITKRHLLISQELCSPDEGLKSRGCQLSELETQRATDETSLYQNRRLYLFILFI